jgi:uncharacterized protein with FMN-binding domain
MNTFEQHSKRKLIATILSVVIIAGIVVFADHLKSTGLPLATTASQDSNASAPDTSTDIDTDTSATTNSTSSTTSTSGTSGYANGTYTASSDYYVPHGEESIQVSLTLKDGVITDSSITNSEGDHDSAAFQEEFASSYKSYVVGQKISGLQLSIISGASDTTQGFNDALSQIASKAQV